MPPSVPMILQQQLAEKHVLDGHEGPSKTRSKKHARRPHISCPNGAGEFTNPNSRWSNGMVKESTQFVFRIVP